MSDAWAKLWGDLPDKPKVKREVRQNGGDALWLWTVLILRAKACDANGRIEIEPGIPATRDEIQEASSLLPLAFERALAVLLRWGAGSPTGWLVQDPDGCFRVRNLGRRQVSAEAERKRRARSPGVTSPGKCPVTSPRTNPPDEEEEEEEEEGPHGVGAAPARETREATEPPSPVRKGSRSGAADPRKRIRLVEDEVTGIARFEGITDEDRSEWAALAPSADIDRELALVLSRRGTHETWFAKRRKGGHWVDTLRAWMAQAQTFADRDRESRTGAVPQARRTPRIVTQPAAPPEPPPPEPTLVLTDPTVPWAKAVELLAARINGETERWILPLRYLGDCGDAMVLQAPDAFHARWVRDNQMEQIKDALFDVVGHAVGVRLVVAAGEDATA